MILKEKSKVYLWIIVFLAICVTTVWSSERKEIDPVIGTYQQLTEWKFTREAIPVPAAGITWKRDNASWVLEQGEIRLMEPTADGKITGLVFEGRGRFRMTIPDWVERDQLKRCSGKKDIKEINETFTRMVMRTPEPFLARLAETPGNAVYVKNSLAKDRHKICIKLAKRDVDARIVAGLVNPGDEFLWVEMKTRALGWLAYSFDRYQEEEIQLQKFRRKYEFVETWVSLDRDSDRTPNGRPSMVRRDQINITRHDIDADLTRLKLAEKSLYGWRDTETAVFRDQVSFISLVDGLRMVRLMIHPRARIKGIFTPDGTELPFIRREINKTFLVKKAKNYDLRFWVLLDKACAKGELGKVTVDYELDIRNFVSGGIWYPVLMDNMNDKHTVSFKAKIRKNLEIRAVGKRLKESVSGNVKTSEWRSEVPGKMYGFTVGKKYKEERLEFDGLPEVVSFGTERAFTTGNMIRNVAVDILNSLRFYKSYFQVDFPYETIYATAIESGHGQAFPGFLHLAQSTYYSERPGASELFRAHEVAHLIWGKILNWKSYRDQWLSESFAEYSSMLFLEATMPDKNYFNDILTAYTNEMTGSTKTLLSKYARPWKMLKDKRNREKMGPIGIGGRASSADAPMGYTMQVYHKGPLVLHMIRVMMRNASGNDQLFCSILRDFLRNHRGKDASTQDFRRIIETRTKQDWSWFFNQWVHGTSIPTYTWSYRNSKGPNGSGKYEVTVTVKQSNVPSGFKMGVPLQVKFGKGDMRQFTLPINKPEQSFNLAFPKKVKRLVLNPDHSVLAKVKKR
ncbi:MAG: M1 family metallopeptidase [bacterium]|nr:M1 family metallopeptidase [bacterium]